MRKWDDCKKCVDCWYFVQNKEGFATGVTKGECTSQPPRFLKENSRTGAYPVITSLTIACPLFKEMPEEEPKLTKKQKAAKKADERF